jgi:flotillin
MLETFFIPIVLGIVAVVVIILTLASTYTVVPPHEAHVVVTRGKGRKLYSSREGDKSSYFMFPIIQKRSIIPLRNKELSIENIPLRDKDIAKFLCDVVCWINVTDPIVASERIGSTDRLKDFTGIHDDITDLVKSVTRNSSMKMDLVSLMSDRLKFSKEIASEISTSIKEWGISLVDLECIHFTDEAGYHVIKDLESRQAKLIEATTRKLVSEREKEAAIKESEMDRETRLKQAENEEKSKQREIKKEEEIGKAEQQKQMAIQIATEKTNEQTVKALRTLNVGKAEVVKQETITKAEGEADANIKTGEAEATVITVKGEAEAKVIKAKAVSEAQGIDAKAEAQKKYTESAMAIEVITAIIEASKQVEIAKFKNLGEAIKEANVNIVATGTQEIFGIPLDTKTGVAIGGMLHSLKLAGFDVSGLMKKAAEVFGKAVDIATGVDDKQKSKKDKNKE